MVQVLPQDKGGLIAREAMNELQKIKRWVEQQPSYRDNNLQSPGRRNNFARLYLATSESDIGPNTVENTVQLWDWGTEADPLATTDTIRDPEYTLENVRLTWIHGGEQVSAGKRMVVAWCQGQYFVLTADCEDPPPNEPNEQEP